MGGSYGRMLLRGTIVHPQARYLHLSGTANARGGPVLCDDSFDSIVVFSEAIWIGTAAPLVAPCCLLRWWYSAASPFRPQSHRRRTPLSISCLSPISSY